MWFLAVSNLVLILLLIEQVSGTRIRLFHDGEPESGAIYNNNRWLFADRSYFYLAAAGLLDKSDISGELFEDTKDANGNYKKANFEFKVSELFRKARSLTWFIPLQERMALHVYDNPDEMNLSGGPKVNQQKCGLLLDYMLFMIDKHYQHFTNSTEYSIFNIMTSYGSPMAGFVAGQAIFPGDYRTCIGHKLNVMKKDLIKVDKFQAERFFQENKKALQSESFFRNLINNYINPFIGVVQASKENENELIKKHSKKLRLVSSKYCMAGLRYKEWKNNTYEKRNMVIRIGTCLPEYCDSNSLTLFHDKIKRLTEVQMADYFKGYYIENLYCLPDEDSALRNPFNYTNSTLFIIFNVLWLFLITLATLIKLIKSYLKKGYSSNRKLRDNSSSDSSQTLIVNKQEATLWNYLKCWSLITNWNRFFGEKRSKAEIVAEQDHESNVGTSKIIEGNLVDLEPLEGVKIVSSFAVIISHCYMVFFAATWNSIYGHDLITKSFIATTITICPSVVDLFFVITGILTSYLFFRDSKEMLTKVNFWIQFFIYRYLRIVPLYILAHWFLQSYFRFLGSGPFWDYGTSESAWQSVCYNDSIWGIVFPMANLKSPSSVCNSVGWYLANDIQATLVTPFFIILFLKNALLAYATTLTIVLAMILNHVRYYYQFPIESRGGLEFSLMTLSQVTDDAALGYVEPQYRLVAYLIGLVAGFLLYSYEKGEIKEWSRWFIYLCKVSCWIWVIITGSLPYISNLLPMQNLKLIHLLGSVLSGTLHGLTSFVAAAFILLLVTGHYPLLSKLLRGKIFRRYSKASMSTLLIHIPLVFYHSNTMRTLPDLNMYFLITATFLQIVESFILSVFVHILYELPMRRFFMKVLLGMFAPKPEKSDSKNSTETSKNTKRKEKEKEN